MIQLFHATGSFFLKSAFVVYLAWIFHIKGIKNRDFFCPSVLQKNWLLCQIGENIKKSRVSIASEVWSSRFLEDTHFWSVICRILWFFICVLEYFLSYFFEVHSKSRILKFFVAQCHFHKEIFPIWIHVMLKFTYHCGCTKNVQSRRSIKIFIMIQKISYLATDNCSIDWKIKYYCN